MLLKVITIFTIIPTILTLVRDLPSGIKKCHLNDPKINDCLLKATELVKPYLIRGVPELNVPSIEPFNIPKITLKQGTQALNFQAQLQNVIIKGLSNYKFSQFDFDVPNLQWFIKARIAPLELNGDYKVTGRILLAPIEGRGKFYANITQATISGYQKVKLIKHDDDDGEEYASPIVTNTTIKVEQPKLVFEGLFGDNTELNNVTNRVVNENIDQLFEDFRPVLETVIVEIFEKALIKALEDRIPFHTLYPSL